MAIEIPDMTNLDIFCNCTGVPAKMLYVYCRTPLLGYRYYVYQCTMCKKKKEVYWESGGLFTPQGLRIKD